MARNKALSSEIRQSMFLFWELKAIPCEKCPRNWRSRTTLCTSPFTEQCKRTLTRIESRVGGPGAQLWKRTSTLECVVWETDSPQLAASLNSSCKTPVSTSTVKRWLQDAGLLGRDTKKKTYLRLANKRLRWAKEHRHWTEELCLEGQHPRVCPLYLSYGSDLQGEYCKNGPCSKLCCCTFQKCWTNSYIDHVRPISFINVLMETTDCLVSACHPLTP
jgi:hypothetical protein